MDRIEIDDSPAASDALDAADPLASFRDRFVIEDPGPVYLDGNSLGRLPRSTAGRLARLVGVGWGRGLIRGWDEWIGLPHRVGDLIGTGLLGARAGEVIVADSTTVDFYRLAVAALDARPGRRAVVTDRDNFPTDRYVLEGLAAARGLEIRWIEADPIGGPTAADVGDLLDDDGDALERFLRRLLAEGIHALPDGRFYVSAMHGLPEVEATLQAISRAL